MFLLVCDVKEKVRDRFYKYVMVKLFLVFEFELMLSIVELLFFVVIRCVILKVCFDD